jgi:hypothetical protein
MQRFLTAGGYTKYEGILGGKTVGGFSDFMRGLDLIGFENL